MNKEIKKLWIEALLSGKYKQAFGSLKNKQNEFCCLGVLCDISQKGEWVDNAYLEESKVLPEEVIQWAGLNTGNPYVRCSDNTLDEDTLACLNDHGKSFQEIAKLIEENL